MELKYIILIITISAITILLFTLLTGKWLSWRIDKNTLAYQNDLLEKHCEEVQNMYRQTRGWRHDYHDHIQTMKAYLIMGKTEELSHFLNELDKDLVALDTVIKTGNIMIDAILNSKISLAKSRDIKVDAKAIVPEKLDMSFSEIDLSLIIGNLMDNAMGRRKRSGRIYKSTKDGAFHGFGLMRIDKVVKRYNGYLDRQDEDGVFVTEIMLPL